MSLSLANKGLHSGSVKKILRRYHPVLLMGDRSSLYLFISGMNSGMKSTDQTRTESGVTVELLQ